MIRPITSRGPPVTRSPVPAEYERLHALYQISSALAGSTGIAQACAATVSIVTRTLQITSAVLLDATAEPPVAWTWTADDGLPGFLEVACERARSGLAYLAPAIIVDDRAPGVRGDVPTNLHFITLPLATPEVFGVFQIQQANQFEERDLVFIDAVVDQLAIACDRHHARVLLEAAIKNREAILGMVSHDLRAPLGTIHLWSELLKSGLRSPEHGIQVIQDSVAQMNRMVGDLLDITSIEARHLSVRTSGERANDLVAEALEGIRSAAAHKGLRIEARLPASEPVVECDRIRILQVLTNLLSNAVKFTSDGGTITATVVEEDGLVRFSVEDTGCGISSRDLTHVFDWYWQSKATAHRGRGLGLAIAKGIVESHGAALSVESEVGRGTTFSFALPLAPVPPGRRDE